MAARCGKLALAREASDLRLKAGDDGTAKIVRCPGLTLRRMEDGPRVWGGGQARNQYDAGSFWNPAA